MYPFVDDREETAWKYDDVERPTHDLQQNTYGNELRPLVNDLNENRRNQGKSIFFSLYAFVIIEFTFNPANRYISRAACDIVSKILLTFLNRQSLQNVPYLIHSLIPKNV